jgi:A/G-specific adenine glycosylase
MLQQTQVQTVIPYYEKWMSRFPTVGHLARAPLDTVLGCWAGLGYYRRARNLHAAAQIVVSRFSGRFPADLQTIMNLPGIGRYTAGAICSIAFNHPTPILDGNIIRVLTRLFAIAGDPRVNPVNQRLWNLADHWVRHAATAMPSRNRPSASLNQALMELGALICTPKKPGCSQCPLKTECRAYASANPASFPQLAPRLSTQTRRYAVFILRHGSQILARRQPHDAWNAGLWGFPAIELNGQKVKPDTLLRGFLNVHSSDLRQVGNIRHSITRYRLSLAVYAATVPAPLTPARNNDTRWCRISTLHRLPLQAAHRKILRLLVRAPITRREE